VSRRLVSSDEAIIGARQHARPCSDCPWSRRSLNGWLGGGSIDEWLRTAHSDALVACHTISNMQCAGIAIYRRNICKRVDPPVLILGADRVAVFSNPMEFRDHHGRLPDFGKRRE
jgi:hypothetical protein